MAYFHPAAVAHRRRLYMRHDAWRLAAPGTPQAKMPDWLDPSATRVRKLIDVDLREISIVTFPLLAGARVRAKGSVSSPPRRARARAEQKWAARQGATPRSRDNLKRAFAAPTPAV